MTKQVKNCLDKLRRVQPKSRRKSNYGGEIKQKWTKKRA